MGERSDFLRDYDFACEYGWKGPWTFQAVEYRRLRDCLGRCGRVRHVSPLCIATGCESRLDGPDHGADGRD
jgi:hypothetical protein